MKKNKAFIFNAYGAILDTYLPFEKYKDQLGEHALVIYKLWRSKRLQYSSQLSLMNRYTNYDLISKYALEFACDVYGMKDAAVKKNILEAHAKLDCYSDVKDVLKTLKDAGKTTAILSNGSPQKLSSALKNAGLTNLLDGIYCTDQIKTYKPSPAVYEFVEEQLALPRHKVCFISSNSWDIAGAASYGFSSVWINRYNRTPEHLPYQADEVISELSELPAMVL
ncbi:MAG: haloacid dehalogenase type II [Gammaproteobacteria bacterium]